MPDTVILHGQADVARWCGVTPQTVSTWMMRYNDCPVPDAVIRNSGKDSVIRGWVADRKPEWIAYAARRAAVPGAVLVSMRSDRRKH